MTTVAQMIEWLKTLPQDAEVECLVEERGDYYTTTIDKPVDLEESSVLDYTSFEDRKMYPQIAGRIFVQLRG
jgi:hypothetical protein